MRKHETAGRGVYRYRVIPAANHPRAYSGLVYEHAIMAEKALGKHLPGKAIVHHVNEDTLDNRPSNLVICENNAYHKLLHQRMRALKYCGRADWIRCRICLRYDDPKNLYIRTKTLAGSGFHRECHARYELERLKRKMHETANISASQTR